MALRVNKKEHDGVMDIAVSRNLTGNPIQDGDQIFGITPRPPGYPGLDAGSKAPAFP